MYLLHVFFKKKALAHAHDPYVLWSHSVTESLEYKERTGFDPTLSLE